MTMYVVFKSNNDELLLTTYLWLAALDCYRPEHFIVLLGSPPYDHYFETEENNS
jgi:hypothetical protein